MELDDLKNTWADIANQQNKQPQLTPEIINDMTKRKYHSTLKTITSSEITGIIVCLGGAIFIALRFSHLDTVFLQITGIVSIGLLLTLSAISLASLRQLNMPVDLTKPYAETLRQFAIQKLKFYKFQKINITLSYLLLVATVVLFSKFFLGKDIAVNKSFWLYSFALGYIFLLFYSKWVSKYYNNKLRQAEDILKELAA